MVVINVDKGKEQGHRYGGCAPARGGGVSKKEEVGKCLSQRHLGLQRSQVALLNITALLNIPDHFYPVV